LFEAAIIESKGMELPALLQDSFLYDYVFDLHIVAFDLAVDPTQGFFASLIERPKVRFCNPKV
jgi:hypothetical protein